MGKVVQKLKDEGKMINSLRKVFMFFLLVVLLLGEVSFAATKGKIRGKVLDAQTEDALPYANVSLLETSLGGSTDAEGEFIVNGVPAGKYTMAVSYIGYKSQKIEINVVAGKILEYDFLLEAESVIGDTIVVTAQASGQKAAINEQLSSIEIKNVVSAARIQELPDANAAESVGRLPGVSILRTGGEGSKVVVRGLSPQYNRVTINGVELPANSTSSDPNDHRTQFSDGDAGLSVSGDRGTDLSMISSNMLGGIEVIKAITPDMDATVLGGVINFAMRKAVTKKPSFEFLLQGSHNKLKDTYSDFKVVGSYEQRFLDNSLGVFIQGSAEQKNLSANQLHASYHFESKLQVTDEGDPEFKYMSLADVLSERERYGATLAFDYQYSTGSIEFLNFYSRSNTTSTNRGEEYRLLGDDIYYNTTHSVNEMDVYSNLLSIKQNLFGFLAEVKLSHSYSGGKNPDDVKFTFWQDFAGFANKLTLLKYAEAKEIASHVEHYEDEAAFFSISNLSNESTDRTLNGMIDLTTDFTINNDVSGKVKFGFSHQHRDREYDYNISDGSVMYDDGSQVTAAILAYYPQFGDNITLSDLVDPNYSYGDFFGGDYQLGSPINKDLMLDVMDIAKANPGVGNGGGYKYNKLASLTSDYHGTEKRTGTYGMITFNLGTMFTLVPGLRYQNITTNYHGIRGEVVPQGIQYTESDETVSHGYYLPMVHLRFKPTDWLQIHFAYTNTLNYPDYNTIIPSYTIGTNYVKYNNYRLKPAQSENFDLMMTFYSNEVGLFSIGGFKKRIKDLIFSSKSYPDDWSFIPEINEIIGDRKESYFLLTYVNSPVPIDVLGIETEWQTHFWYLPGVLSGLVLNVNYTHVFSEAEYPKSYLTTYLDSNWIQQTESHDTTYTSRLLNQPNDIFNISLGYDYADFSCRLSLLYQENIFKNPDFWLQNRIHSDAYTRLDFSARQKLPWYGLSAYINLGNITGEEDVDINQKTSFKTARYNYGMTIDLGIRMKL